MSRLTLADLDALILKHSAHDPDSTYCVMEAHAAMVGEKWTDSPPDVSPVIAVFMRAWNDGLPDDELRTRLLVPILREGIMRDTAGSPTLEDRRSWMAFDWLVREHATAWMDLTPALAPHATALRGLPILTANSIALAIPLLDAAWAAAGDAARAAAWAALVPTTIKLQASAQDLVRRMCAEKE